MTKLPAESLPDLYSRLMREIKFRMDAAEDAFQQAISDLNKPRSILDYEFCCVQYRRCCECVALATLVAHNGIEQFRNGRLLAEASGPKLITMLGKLSNDAFPEPTAIKNREPDNSAADLMIEAKAKENRRTLNKIYADCGDRLHSGSLKSLLKSGGKRYNFAEIQKWKKFFVDLLNSHAVLMPDRKSVMLVFMRHDSDDDVNCQFLAIEDVGGRPLIFPPQSQPRP